MNNIEKYKLKDIGKWEDRIYDYINTFGDKDGEFPVTAGRYRLIGTAADAFSQYIEIIIKTQLLDDVISIGRLNSLRPDKEFADYDFSLDEGGIDPVLKIESLSSIYKNTDSDKKLDYTVPILVDVTSGKIVLNDPFKISEELEGVWRSTFSPDSAQLRPDSLKSRIEGLNFDIFTNLFMEGYRAGFAEEQLDYDKGYTAVFAQLDRFEKHLSKSRYLLGDRITDSDVLLYTFLARFDIEYAAGYRINRNLLRDFPNLWGYARELYQIKAFSETTDFEAIKKHTFLDNVVTNPYRKLPLGLGTDDWALPHGRG